MKPSSKDVAQDPSNNYERSHPENEAGMGRLDNNKSTPTAGADRQNDDVKNKQDPSGQINAHEVVDAAASRDLSQPQPDHSMKDEEPMGWDQAPTGSTSSGAKRHPRTEGKGGTP